MLSTKITVQTTVAAPVARVWLYFTQPQHIVHWNFASPDWHCPKADCNLQPGGTFSYHMAAKDGSFSFDFEGTYLEVIPEQKIVYTMSDGRQTVVLFESSGNQTTITETFDAETTHPVQQQQSGWQAILQNFKSYAEQGE